MTTHTTILKQLIGATAGQQNVLGIPRLYIELLGNHTVALFLSQLVYWQTKKPDGDIAKSQDDWYEELCITAYQVRAAIKKCEEKEIEITVTKRKSPFYGGNTVNHYHLDLDSLAGALLKNLTTRCEKTSQPVVKKLDDPNTETTTETTNKEKDSPQAVSGSNSEEETRPPHCNDDCYGAPYICNPCSFPDPPAIDPSPLTPEEAKHAIELAKEHNLLEPNDCPLPTLCEKAGSELCVPGECVVPGDRVVEPMTGTKPEQNELPSWWTSLHTSIIVTGLIDGKVSRRNRAINRWDQSVSELATQGYLRHIGINDAQATRKGRGLATNPVISSAKVAREAVQAVRSEKKAAPKKKAKKKRKYGLDTFAPEHQAVMTALAGEYYGKLWDNLCHSERGQIVKAFPDFATPEEVERTVAYCRHMSKDGNLTMTAVVNLGKHKTAAERWQQEQQVKATPPTLDVSNFEVE
jgi:hypothetical protein